MPELPEVETMRRGVSCLAGRQIIDVQRPPCAKRPIQIAPRIDAFRRRTLGRRIAAVERVGKRVVLALDSGDAIVFEPRMTGLVLLADPPTVEHLRLSIRVESPRCQLLFWDRRGLGSVRLVDRSRFEKLYSSATIGPDALCITSVELSQRLGKSRRAVKVALLDQRALAGVGNLYASEILHVAGIHPQQMCHRLRPEEWRRIHQAMRQVLETAIRYEGSTLSDGTYRNALNQNGGYQAHHRVYGRHNQPCLTCGQHSVQRIVQAQRSTFFCAYCQSKRSSRKTIEKDCISSRASV
jgi:formamidopyrimidine-DNA glycosylase